MKVFGIAPTAAPLIPRTQKRSGRTKNIPASSRVIDGRNPQEKKLIEFDDSIKGIAQSGMTLEKVSLAPSEQHWLKAGEKTGTMVIALKQYFLKNS